MLFVHLIEFRSPETAGYILLIIVVVSLDSLIERNGVLDWDELGQRHKLLAFGWGFFIFCRINPFKDLVPLPVSHLPILHYLPHLRI